MDKYTLCSNITILMVTWPEPTNRRTKVNFFSIWQVFRHGFFLGGAFFGRKRDFFAICYLKTGYSYLLSPSPFISIFIRYGWTSPWIRAHAAWEFPGGSPFKSNRVNTNGNINKSAPPTSKRLTFSSEFWKKFTFLHSYVFPRPLLGQKSEFFGKETKNTILYSLLMFIRLS